jgi:hypothetical protein
MGHNRSEDTCLHQAAAAQGLLLQLPRETQTARCLRKVIIHSMHLGNNKQRQYTKHVQQSGRTRWESGRADERARQDRERRGEGARAGWAGWAERPRGAGGMGHFVFFFYSSNCFPFSFYLLYLIQFQIGHKFKLAPPSIMHQTKVKFRV